jgi:acetoin utilization deacetylase AcuC-like enzyme
MALATGIVKDYRYLRHETGHYHPESPKRLESIYKMLESPETAGKFVEVKPRFALEEELEMIHKRSYVKMIAQSAGKDHTYLDPDTEASAESYDVAKLAVGGFLNAVDGIVKGELRNAFAFVRPPGHHASPGSCWGFCWFNNVAIAVEKIKRSGVIKKALIIDIDLHYGDGTANIFFNNADIIYHHVEGNTQQDFLKDLEDFIAARKNYDIVAVSAGFDRHAADWGGLLSTENYTQIGKIIKTHAQQVCQGRVFAVLEGGYNHNVLGKNVKALLSGLE